MPPIQPGLAGESVDRRPHSMIFKSRLGIEQPQRCIPTRLGYFRVGAVIGYSGMSITDLLANSSRTNPTIDSLVVPVGPMKTAYSKGLCAFKLSNDRDALGVCTQPCERTCPDRQQPHTSVTFCMDSPEGGLCVARCDDRLFANTDGCDLGLMCVQANRPNDLTRTQDVCAPTDPEG